MSFDLSILIPARNEEWLKRTIEGIIACSGPRTEVIAVLDGAWPQPGLELEQHERVTVLFNPEPVGQRAAVNQAARISKARWVMKCDAHVIFSPGFDEVLMQAMEGHDDWTISPKMFNLHAFDWVCQACGKEDYQGPTPDKCDGCGQGPMERRIAWVPRRKELGCRVDGPESTAMRFDDDLHFQYWGGYKRRQVWVDDCAETMSILGACWMLTRERYHELNICDEAHGSWGQQGTEVACKTWLSGGRLVVHRGCWFAHLFRTQGGDFGFPYPNPGSKQEEARRYSRWLWLGDNWEQAIHPLSWLIEKFAPVPDWEVNKGVVFYTDNRVPVRIAKEVQKMIRDQALPITSCSIKPMPNFGNNIHLPGERGHLQMFRQILAALEAAEQDVIFLCEHDVLYHPSHFEFKPPKDDVFYYNVNVWKVRLEDGFAVRVDDARQVSGLCASRNLLLEHYRERVRRVELEGFSRDMGFEPGTHNRAGRVDDYKSEVWSSEFPNVDIRLPGALTKSRWSPDEYRNKKFARGWTESTLTDIPGWDDEDGFSTLSYLLTLVKV